MGKVLGLLKIGAAALLVLAVVFAVILNFDPKDVALSLGVFVACLLITAVYCCYLVPTAMHDIRGVGKPLPWWILPGLLLFVLSCAYAIHKAAEDLRLYGSVIPFALIGLFIGIRDAFRYKRSRTKAISVDRSVTRSVVESDAQLAFSVQIQQAEWVWFCLRNTYRTPVIIWMTFIGVGMGSGLLFVTATGADVPWYSLFFGAFMAGTALFLIPFLTWRLALKQYKQEMWIGQLIRYEASANGLDISTPGAEIHFDRDKVVLEERIGWLIIKTGRDVGLYIPPRVLNEDQRAGFKHILTLANTGLRG